MEKVANNLMFPCKHKQTGCRMSLGLNEKAEHEEVCEFRPYSCPCPGASCSWQVCPKRSASIKSTVIVVIISGSTRKSYGTLTTRSSKYYHPKRGRYSFPCNWNKFTWGGGLGDDAKLFWTPFHVNIRETGKMWWPHAVLCYRSVNWIA